MRFSKVMLISVIAAFIIAIPLTLAIDGKNNELKIERSEKEALKIDKKATEDQVQLQMQTIEQKQVESDTLKQENDKLKADLQAKLERQEAERIAAEAEQARIASVAASTPAPAASGNCESYRPIVAKYPWNVDQAMLVMQKESGCRPNAVSATNDHGLYQINGGLQKHGNSIYDPEFNVKLAYEGFYAQRGWTPWYAVKGILW